MDFAAPIPLHTDFFKGNFEGFEVDLMNKIVNELNLNLEYSISYWKDILNDLQNKKIDVVCSAATKTYEREKEFLFSKPYLNFHLCLVCNKDNMLQIDNLENKRVGVRTSTEAEKYLKKKYPKKSLEHFDSNEEIYNKLTKREIDALVDDSPISFGFTERNSQLSIVELLPNTSSQYAIMLNKDNADLKNKIDEIIDELENSIFLEEKRQKWFNGEKL